MSYGQDFLTLSLFRKKRTLNQKKDIEKIDGTESRVSI